MKERHGFVSNSSSTSFAVYGVYIDDREELCDKLVGKKKVTKTPGCEHKFDRDKNKFCSECGKVAYIVAEEKRCATEQLEEYFKKKDLEWVQWDGGDRCYAGYYVGIHLRNANLNKSPNKLGMLKEVEDRLKEIFDADKICFYSDGGYNG